LRRAWWASLLERARGRSSLTARLSPTTRGYINTTAGTPGLSMGYVVWQDEGRVELYIDRGDREENKKIFDELFSHRAEIERGFGGELTWERLEKRRASRVAFDVNTGGYRSPTEAWPDIQDETIDAMMRFEAALRPFVERVGS
jgi:hypothetical protein